MRSTLLLALALITACGGDDTTKTPDARPPVDAAPPPVDAAAPPVTLDCTTYCGLIKTNCTGLNAQYTDDAHCMGLCSKLTPGALTDMSGNTLGCRIYHAQNAAKAGQTPEVHCPHAGPGGAAISNLATPPSVCGDACTSFCTEEIAACGLAGASATGQYASMTACMTACGGMGTGFDKTHLYVIDGTKTPPTTPTGDSLACRLYHTTNAAITGNAATHCPHTSIAGGAAAGTCMAGTAPAP